MVSVEIIMSFLQPRKVLKIQKKKKPSEMLYYLNGAKDSSCNLRIFRRKGEHTVCTCLFWGYMF